MPSTSWTPSPETVGTVRVALHQLNPNEDYSTAQLVDLLRFNVPELRGLMHRATITAAYPNAIQPARRDKTARGRPAKGNGQHHWHGIGGHPPPADCANCGTFTRPLYRLNVRTLCASRTPDAFQQDGVIQTLELPDELA